MNSFSKKELIIALILVPLWIAGYISAYRAEYAAINIIPDLFKMNSEEKALATGGAIYTLSQRINASLPLDPKVNTVYFFNPVEGGGYSKRLKYYLYPRKMVEVEPGSQIRISEMNSGDLAVIFTPAGSPDTGAEAALSGVVTLERVHESTDGSGRQAIYRIIKEGR